MKNNIFCFTLGICVGIIGLLTGVYISEERYKWKW